MEILRTPDERFAALPDFPYTPRYVEIDGLRMHYIDEGPRDGATVLCLHGEPSWSFVYRKMLPGLTDAGLRVVAPDFIGFGRSDKPAARGDYTYQRHVDWMHGFLRALDLRGVTLFGHDWGGLIGLRLVADDESRFARVVAANTMLVTGDQQLPKAFYRWQKLSQEVADLDIGRTIEGGCARPVAPEVLAAYAAPFPDERYKAGARAFPALVPTRPDDPASANTRAAWKALRRFEKPFLTVFGDSDPITRGADQALQAQIPGAAGQPHATIERAGHFLQEDAGEAIAAVVARFVTG